MTQPNPELTPVELIETAAPADPVDDRPFAEKVLEGLVAAADGNRIPSLDGHVFLGADATKGKGGSLTVTGSVVPAGEGDPVGFTLTVTP